MEVVAVFVDRVQAGRMLAEKLREYEGSRRAVVLGIPRGGVVVAAEVAKELHLPLGVAIAAKIGSPGNPEYAVGAVTPDGQVAVNPMAGMTHEQVGRIADVAREKADRYDKTLRGDRPPLDLHDRVALLVDDGLATGLTARAAVQWLARQGAQKVVVAVPVGSEEAVESLKAVADEVVAVDVPSDFWAVGQFYQSFPQTEDEEVITLLRTVNQEVPR